MKKFLAALLLVLPVITHAQNNNPVFYWDKNVITTDINGRVIAKDDTVELKLMVHPHGTNVRSAYLDFQHQKDAIQLLSIERGAAYDANANFSVNNYFYPNCQFNRTSQNTTDNGRTNWNYATYTCNSNTVPYNAINRIMVNIATGNNLSQDSYIKLRFKITNTTAGFPYDSVYFNFVIPYDANGSEAWQNSNTMSGVKGVWIQLSPTANNLITGTVTQGVNVSSGLKSLMKVSVTDTLTQPTEVTNSTVSAGFNFGSQLTANTWYRYRLLVPADSIAALSKASVTVSDYTTAVQEFITQNLDKTYKNNNITKGIMYWAADVNNNGEFDGGDIQKLFNAVTGLDTLVKAPAGCAANCYVTLPTILGSVYDTLGFTAWKTFTNPYFTQFKTTATNQNLSLKYVLKGDVNLSHSSAVGSTAAAASLVMNNFIVPGSPGIDVTLANSIVTTNDVTVPFTIDTKGIKLTGLQFEVKFDQTKLNFDKLEVNTPSWVSFVNNNNGIIRFGALDKDVKNTLTGSNLVPFKLHFTTKQAGADLSTAVEIYPTMDAADDKGNQVGINFNTTVIKLIGANFFKP